MTKRGWNGLIACVLVSLFFAVGCAHKQAVEPDEVQTAYLPRHAQGTLLGRFAPAFLVHDAGRDYNRIGRPSAQIESGNDIRIFVDVGDPVFYVQERAFTTDRAHYLNLIYRVHFPKIPYSMLPFHLTAGRNVGLMVVVTLDASERPVLVTTVHTCGCYAATVPSTYLPPQRLPEDWQKRSLKQTSFEVYGERLPWSIDYDAGGEQPRLLVHLRPGVHRVMHMEVVNEGTLRDADRFFLVRAPFERVQRLETLPLDGSTTSFYYGKGLLRGHVKGSVKPWETLFMSPVSLDLFVGADKVYADKKESGNPFYTSLKPWNRNRSDMWNFARFLEFYGWRL